MFSLMDRVAIVTGSGRNIGKAIALGLAEAGADIVTSARTKEEIEATAEEIRRRGRRALAVPADVRMEDQVRHLVEKTVAEFGRVDILVNNAGGLFSASSLEMNERAWDALIRENLKPPFLCSQAVAKLMIAQKRKGCIINTASLAGLGPYPVSPAYAAAKAGLINFTRTLAVELAPYQIRVNAVAPGYVVHPGSVAFFQMDNPEIRQRLLTQVPLGRFGQPEDIVGAVIYLASDAASYVTGSVLVIDGGQLTW